MLSLESKQCLNSTKRWDNFFRRSPLVYAQTNHVLLALLKPFLLNSVAEIVRQDVATVENLYPRQPPKIKLPLEEIMLHAEKLYQNWNSNKSR